jgi:hypothetical protein
MNASPDEGQDPPDAEADRQADAMKDQLRKDVASWSAARSGDSTDLGARPNAQTAKPAATPRASRAKAKPVAPVVAPAATEKKPFKMFYDGTTDKDYIAQRIKLGAR